MSRFTLYFGAILTGIGIYFFMVTGSTHPTALIPVWFGLAIAACGLFADSKDVSRRKLFMHIAVTVGLVGFLFPGFMVAKDLAKAHSEGLPVAHPAAVHEQLLMAILCFIFVLFCVRSFIIARRSRTL